MDFFEDQEAGGFHKKIGPELMETIVVGAGISGLALSGFLRDDSKLTLLEASAELGGYVRSEPIHGVLHQWGANGFLDNEAAADALIAALDLTPLAAQGGSRFLLHKGRPTALPAKPQQILSSPLLGFWSKLRLLCEPFRSVRTEEQSVAAYLEHRLGRGVTAAFADAFVSGIWAGDPRQLSMQAAFPRLVAEVETHGSLLKALKAKRKTGSKAPTLTSFEGGLGAVGKAVEHRIKGQIQKGCTVQAMTPTAEGWTLTTSTGTLNSHRVVLALSAWRSADLLEPIVPRAAELLREIPRAPVAVVHTVFSAEGWTPPQGFGVLCPQRENSHSLGLLYSSSIFPAHCPSDRVVVRSILGGVLNPAIIEQDPQEIQRLALEDIKHMLPESPQPLSQHCILHREGIPQYTLGHRERLSEIEQELSRFEGLHLIGNFVGGVAVKDCIRVAQDCALRLIEP